MHLLEVCKTRKIKVYGTALGDKLEEALADKLATMSDVRYVLLHDSVPINARPCQRPGSRLGQLVLMDGKIVGIRIYKSKEPYVVSSS